MCEPDIDSVTRLLQKVAQELVMPRFRRLRSDQIERKCTPADPDDEVTVADREVEERLARVLPDLAPPAPVVGEEMAHVRPELLQLLDADAPLWMLDPIDGTRNFARGRDSFGIMLAWIVGGHARAAWLVLPARNQVFVAEAGSGAFLNGARVQVLPSARTEEPRGTIFTRYMPAALAETIATAARDRYAAVQESGCAAVEYTDVLQGRTEFAIYHRLLPWDHAAPALVLTEAGGCVEHADGRTYSARSVHQPTVVARDQVMSRDVRAWLQPATASAATG